MKPALTISEIDIYPLKPKGGLVGFVSFLLNDSFYVGGIGIHVTPRGNVRLVYPTKALPNGKNLTLFHPINKEAGELIGQAVSKKLELLR